MPPKKKVISSQAFIKFGLPALLILALIIIALTSFRGPGKIKELKPEEAKNKAEVFINTYLMQSGLQAKIMDVSEEYGLYKLQIDITSDIVESYLSKDGKLFFPQALDIEEIDQMNVEDSAAAMVATVDSKSEQPHIELFIMSHCPFSTQLEKGIIPVLELLGNKVKFELNFVDYAMHDEIELQEQLAQYCIQKNETSKLLPYLNCFVQSGNSAVCLSEVGIKQSGLTSCISSTDKEYSVMENFNNQVGYQGPYPGFDIDKEDNLKYEVSGSPTLIINGQQISPGRDSASLLLSVCSAFIDQPEECSFVLPSETPAPGFGSGTVSAANSSSECGPTQ